MNNTKIQLIGANTGYLDLKENTNAPLTLAIADIKDLSKKKGTFSKSITLAGTKNNNILLNNYFDVNIQAGTFDVNKVVECNLIQNDIPILENGVMQLVSVNKVQTDGNLEDEVTYTVLIKDSTSDFFTLINNKELTDLQGFDWMTHKYTAQNVYSSFTHTISNGYKYVMPFNPEGSTQTNSTYNDAEFDLREFKPAVYARIYFDKIFQQAGYSYYWPDMDDNDVRFSKLLIPFNGEEPSLENIEQESSTAYVQSTTPQLFATRNFYVAFADDARIEICDGVNQIITFPIEISDPSNNWNTTNNRYTPPNLPSNQNSLEVEYEVNYEVITTNPGAAAYLVRYDSGAPTNEFELYPVVNIKKSGTQQRFTYTTLLDNGNTIKFPNLMVVPTGTTVHKTGNHSFTQRVAGIDALASYDINLINTVSVGWMFKNVATPSGLSRNNIDFKVRITSITAKIKTLVSGTYGYNTDVLIKQYIPQKVKQSDFIKSIFTMFNIYVEVDVNNSKRLNLYSRDKYYDSGKINDWTKKLVKDKPQEVKFIPELTSKSITLTYKEDSDTVNKIYKEGTGEIYGQQKFTFDNEFVKEEKKQEIIFSPTPMFNTSFGAVSPMWLGMSPKVNVRILYDGGALPCQTYKIINYTFQNNTNQVTYTSYPHISHWDKPTNPTYDLNFGVCDYYFRSDNYGSLTNNNLFNLHWRRTLNQINNGKLMTAYFNLNETDVKNLKLNDKIKIDNSWWNMNKVQDYDANSNQPTKVELISIDDNLEIKFPIRRVRDVSIYDAELITSPIRLLDIGRNNLLNINLSNIEIKGKYNYVTENVTSGIIVGNNNIVSNNAEVYGNNNVVSSEAIVNGDFNEINSESNGVIIYGNFNQPISGNTMYVDNIVLPSGGTINIGGATISTGGTITNYVTTNTTQTVTGAKTFNNVPLIKKTNTAVYPNVSGGVYIIGPNGSYDTFEFYSFDGTDQDSFGSVQIYSNPEEGNTIYHNSLDNQYTSNLNVKNFDLSLVNLYAGQRTALYVDGQTDKIIIEGTQNKFAALGTALITGTKNFEFPNQSGTLALLSDITGGTGPILFTGGTGTNSIVSIQNPGFPNTASGANSFAIGYGTQATGTTSHAEGSLTKAFGQYSHAEGNSTIANGTASHAEGGSTLAFSDYSHAEGYSTQANNTSAHAEGDTTIANTIHSHAGGRKSVSTVVGEWCRSGSDLSNIMIPQYGIIDLTKRTTGTAITEITAGGGTPTTSNTISLIPGTTMRYKFVAIAVNETNGACKEWEGQGLIKNVGGTTAMVGSTNVSTYADTGMAAVFLGVAANNTNDRLAFEGQGLTATSIRWYVKVDYIKMN